MTRRLSRTNTRATEGSALVESALALLLVSVVAIGIADIGQVLVFHQGVVDRAKVGARWAVTNPYDSNRIKNVILYSTPDPQPGARALLRLEPDMITTALLDANTAEARIMVSIRDYRFYFFSPFISGAKTARPIAVSMPLEEK